MKHICGTTKEEHTRKENMSRGWLRAPSKQYQIAKPVCPESLIPRFMNTAKLWEPGYLPLLTSPHSNRSFSECVSNRAPSGTDPKARMSTLLLSVVEWTSRLKVILTGSPSSWNLRTTSPVIVKFQMLILIDTLLAHSLSSCVRKVAEARSAGSTPAATIAIRMVAIPSRIWQLMSTGFFCAWKGNWRKSIANLRDHPHLPFGLLLKQEDLRKMK